MYIYMCLYIYICMSDFPPIGVLCIFIIPAFCRESRFSMVFHDKIGTLEGAAFPEKNPVLYGNFLACIPPPRMHSSPAEQ